MRTVSIKLPRKRTGPQKTRNPAIAEAIAGFAGSGKLSTLRSRVTEAKAQKGRPEQRESKGTQGHTPGSKSADGAEVKQEMLDRE
jgi:hypothetical protein